MPHPAFVMALASTAAALASVVELVRILTVGHLLALLALAAAAGGHTLAYYRPRPALLLAAAAPLAAAAVGWDPTVPWTVAVFSALVLSMRGLSGLATGIVLGAANLAAVGIYSGTIAVHDNPGAGVAAATAVAAAAAGSAIRDHRRYLSELHDRTQEALAFRALAVERGVAQERLRIARDLHDGVGHHMALINIRLGAAEVHLPADAAAARGDLAAARTELQAVLAETQRILVVLRSDGESSTEATAAFARIPDLIDTARAAGLPVEADVAPMPEALDAEASAAAYRITQEILTNAHRHGTGPLRLRIGPVRSGLSIEATNAQATPAEAGAHHGHGLVGARERAESAGGHLDVDAGGGLFRVHAVLPGPASEPPAGPGGAR